MVDNTEDLGTSYPLEAVVELVDPLDLLQEGQQVLALGVQLVLALVVLRVLQLAGLAILAVVVLVVQSLAGEGDKWD